jgi:hypothetical protein
MKEPEEIFAIYRARFDAMGPDFARMRAIAAVVDGDIVIPLAEMHKNEKAAVPNLAQQGLDQLGKRIASVMPLVSYPPLYASDAADKAARERSNLTYGWWAKNRMKKKLGRRARWYLGYACAPVIIKPGVDGIPKWIPRDPLNTYPADTDIDEYTPSDCIFRTQHTYQWLVEHHPNAAGRIRKPANWDPDDPNHVNTKFDVLEYNDAEEDTLIVCGYDKTDYHRVEALGSSAEILSQVPNRAGMCWAVVPGRITLNKPLGHFDGILGMYQTSAEIMAMQIIATKRAIWPREWLVANPGETPRILSIPDPTQGRPGRLAGGRLEQQKIDPSMAALQILNVIDTAQRQTASLPAEFGGQASSTVQTGRRGGQIMSAAIDFTIEEANTVFAESLYEEDKRAIAIDKTYFNTQKTYHVITRGFQGKISYTPTKLWESDEHVVDYPFAGVDLQNLPVEGGQRVAQETMSQQTFMEMDPAIPDVSGEMQRIWVQKARRAWFASFEVEASQPEGPYRPTDVAQIIKYLRSGMAPEDALEKYENELKALQAEGAPPGAPEAMPGLSPEGAPGEVPTTTPEAEPSLSNFQGLLSRMATTQTAQRFR